MYILLYIFNLCSRRTLYSFINLSAVTRLQILYDCYNFVMKMNLV